MPTPLVGSATRNLKFHAVAKGDRTVGDGDQHATVEISCSPTDADHVKFVRECLKDAFESIFDARVRVLTDDEWQDEQRDS